MAAPVGVIELAPDLESLMRLAFYHCETQLDFLTCVSSSYALCAGESFLPDEYDQIAKISSWARERVEAMPEPSSAVLDQVRTKDDAVQAFIARRI